MSSWPPSFPSPRTTNRAADPRAVIGRSEPSLGPAARQPHGRLNARVGQVGQILGGHFQGKTADDVVVADTEALPPAKPAQSELLIVFLGQPGDGLPELVDQGRPIPALGPSLQPIEQLGVADQDLAQVLAGAENLEQDLGRAMVLREQAQRRARTAARRP